MLVYKNHSTCYKKENTNPEVNTLHPVKSGENAVAKTLF
jgi:hypothetical protein